MHHHATHDGSIGACKRGLPLQFKRIARAQVEGKFVRLLCVSHIGNLHAVRGLEQFNLSAFAREEYYGTSKNMGVAAKTLGFLKSRVRMLCRDRDQDREKD